jgi:hypothetical protein
MLKVRENARRAADMVGNLAVEVATRSRARTGYSEASVRSLRAAFPARMGGPRG